MKRFSSKIDWLIQFALIVAIAGALLPVILEPAPERTEYWMMVAMGGAVSVLIVWLLAGTHYTIDGNHLIVKAGPFGWQIRISEVESVTAARTLLSGPALSLDRLIIRYSGGKRLIVSPDDKHQFAAALGHPLQR